MFTALLPLLVIGISLAVGRGVLSALGELGMPVSQFTVAFMTAILLGAGTDYTVFLISRYHEQRRAQVAPDQAVEHATASIGRVILASAATVALAFAAMVFANLSVFAGMGPACAVAVPGRVRGDRDTVAAGAVAGRETRYRRTQVRPHPPLLELRGRGRGAQAVPLLLVSLAILLALSAVATTMTLSYDDRKGQPATTASNQGYQLLDRHFRKDIVISEFLVVESPTDMRTGKGLADLDEMASRIAQVPGVTKVSGVTRPAGARLEQAQLGWQNGQIGDKMAGAVDDGNARKDDLAKLTGGADQLAGGLAQLDTTLRTALTPLTGILDQAQTAGQQVDQFRPLLKQLSATAPAVDQALRSGPGLRPLAEQADGAIATHRPAGGRPEHLAVVRDHTAMRPNPRPSPSPHDAAQRRVLHTRSPGSATPSARTHPWPTPWPTSKPQSPRWTRRSARSVTPPTWPATSADSKTASANSPRAPKPWPPACTPWPTATSKCSAG